MQRLISLKLTSNLPTKVSSFTTLCHFQPHKTLSLSKTHTQNHFFTSFPTHPLLNSHSWNSQHSLAQRIHGFLSNPLLTRHSLLHSGNTLLRVSSKRLLDCRINFLQRKLPKQSELNINPSQSSHQSDRSSWFQKVSTSGLILGLIVANVSVHLIWKWKIVDSFFVYCYLFNSLYNFVCGRLHTLVTSAFSHTETGSLVSNMFGLYVFGMNIGRNFGPKFLLKMYLAGAIGGSVFFLVYHAFLHRAASPKGRLVHIKYPFGGLVGPSSVGKDKLEFFTYPGVGASGAVNAIMLLDIFLHPTAKLYFIIPVPAMLLGIFLIGMDIRKIIKGSPHVSGSVHLGGAAVAAIAWARIRKGRRVL